MSANSASASVDEFIELLNAEQHVDLQKLRDYARHGIQPEVRGEAWLYLLGVLSEDKSQEMTSVRSKYHEYEELNKRNASLEQRIQSECSRYYQRKLIARSPQGTGLTRSAQRIPYRPSSLASASTTIHTSLSSAYLSRSSSLSTLFGSSSLESIPATPIERNAPRGEGAVRSRPGAMNSSMPGGALNAPAEDEDPEAFIAADMKRFSSSVASVICAYLNRWAWKPAAETKQAELDTTQLPPHEVHEDAWMEEEQTANDRERSLSGSGKSELRDSRHEAAASPSIVAPSEVDAARSRSRAASTVSSGAGSTVSSYTSSQYADVSQSISALPRPSSRAQPHEAGEGAMQASSLLPTSHARAAAAAVSGPTFQPDLVFLCAPFVRCVRIEAGMYFAFERLMSMIEAHNIAHPLPQRVSAFLTLFRTSLPELYSYFEEEEIDVVGFATSWLRHLLAGELRIDDLLRLWDTYFAVPNPLDLHLYVCIAILTNYKDVLEELDQSEAKSMLYSLPPLDIDRIINEAMNIRLAARQAEESED